MPHAYAAQAPTGVAFLHCSRLQPWWHMCMLPTAGKFKLRKPFECCTLLTGAARLQRMRVVHWEPKGKAEKSGVANVNKRNEGAG